jgi:hypothetical protein
MDSLIKNKIAQRRGEQPRQKIKIPKNAKNAQHPPDSIKPIWKPPTKVQWL